MHRAVIRRYKACKELSDFWLSLLYATVAFVGALVVNNYAIVFATEHASNNVTDLILSNIPTYDVDNLFVYGTFFVIGITAFILFENPQRIPFALNAIALFLIIRSGFTSLTHVAPYPHPEVNFGETIQRSFFVGDRFFSGHTGLPFLGALMLWGEKPFRYFYLAASLGFAIIVFLGHLHYSIDVFAAFFITYTIFQIAKWLFPKEWEWFGAKS